MYDPGAKVKAKLAMIDKSQLWLVDRLAEVGIKTNPTSLSKILRGVYKSPRSDFVIITADKIIEEYIKRGRCRET